MKVSRPHLTWTEGLALAGLLATGGLGVRDLSQGAVSGGLILVSLLPLLAGMLLLARQARAGRRSEAVLRGLLRASHDAVLAIDHGGRVVLANAQAEALFDYGRGELLGRAVRDLLPCTEAESQTSRAGQRRDGSAVTLGVNAVDLPEPGAPDCVMAVRDITPARKTEQELQARDAHLKLVVEQMPAILWTTDSQLRLTSTVGGGLASLGVQPQELVGMSMGECLGHEDLEAAPVAAHLGALRGQSLNYEMAWKDRTFQVRVDPLRDRHRKIVGTIGLVLDVTDRKEAEKARDRLAAILEATPDCVAIAAADGRLLYLNRAGRRLAGLDDGADPGAATGLQLFPADAVEAAVSAGAWSGEGVLRSPGGKDFPVSQVILAHAAPGGVVEFLSTVARDVSERKRLEEQLRQAQKMEAVGRLAGGVAHDFNNLLCVITGYSELLLGGLKAGEPSHGPLLEVKKAADRAAGLTRQLLAFSRKQILTPCVLNLNTLVGDMGRMLRRLIGEDVELRTELEPALHLVTADAGQVEQILMNLAVNARDAMPQGGRLTIATRNVELTPGQARELPEVRPGPHAVLEVSDTGCGMDDWVKAHLFEPFFTTKAVGEGTGLGLATVYGIVKQSGGHVAVESAPGRGATFRVYFPLARRPDGLAAEAAPAEVPRGSETVLLVEDEDGVRSLARRVLREGGYTVLEARNGDEALALSKGHPGPIHLLLSDVVMPGTSGVQLSRLLAPLRPQMKHLLMSGFTDTALVRYGVQAGEVEYLAKPFAPQMLVRKVREVLDRAAGPSVPSPADRRRAVRRPARSTVVVDCREGRLGSDGNVAERLIDVSRDGLAVELRQRLMEGQEVEVILSWPGCLGEMRLSAQVAWIRPAGTDNFRAGLSFGRRLSPSEIHILAD